MPTIAREAIPTVELPSEPHTCEPLGGDVLVRGMDMPQLLRFMSQRRELEALLEGETPDQAQARVGSEQVAQVLSWCVVLDDGKPVYSVAQWRAFGAAHPVEALEMFNAAMRLSGSDVRAEKKT